jgi:hypothetical protein
MSDGADKAHQEKEKKTGAGERLVPHSTQTEGDRELREVADEAETARVEAYRETGYVAAPGVGDYHAARRAAKYENVAGISGEPDDPAKKVVGPAKEAAAEMRKEAAQLRRSSGTQRRDAEPAGRRSTPQSQTGGDSASTGSAPGGAGTTGSSGTTPPRSATETGKSGSSTAKPKS